MWDTTYGITRVVKHKSTSKRSAVDWGYPLQRISAELKVRQGNLIPLTPRIIPARLLLCDFRPTWIGLFTEHAVPCGADIVLTIEEPHRFFCFGKVIQSSRLLQVSRVISAHRFDYRTCVEIVFHSKEEFFSIRKYAQEIHSSKKAHPTLITAA